jgi:hypothetical protein
MRKLIDRLLDDLADRIALRVDDLAQARLQPPTIHSLDDDRYTDFERSLIAQRKVAHGGQIAGVGAEGLMDTLRDEH